MAFDTEKERNTAYYELFTSPLGERVLEDLRAEFFDILTYAPGVNANVNDTIYAEGNRNVVAMILGRLEEYKTATPDNGLRGDYL